MLAFKISYFKGEDCKMRKLRFGVSSNIGRGYENHQSVEVLQKKIKDYALQ